MNSHFNNSILFYLENKNVHKYYISIIDNLFYTHNKVKK